MAMGCSGKLTLNHSSLNFFMAMGCSGKLTMNYSSFELFNAHGMFSGKLTLQNSSLNILMTIEFELITNNPVTQAVFAWKL